ncbi:MAG TPA: thioredoxin family protein [Xanthobacteraceae bacterium]|nr:thioredoxin family protein [Xanthobacteraceae bacterium]
MQPHKIVSREEWIEARKKHLKSEKALTRLGDMVSAERQALPWVRVEKDYRFDTPAGTRTLADLFGRNSQLMVYHFMWLWKKGVGCDGCSFLCDHIDGANQHLKHHDVSIVAVSRGKLADLMAYKKRMGWQFDMASSYGSDFNYDYGVSFTEEQLADGKVFYNYEMTADGFNELPGISVFFKNDAGEIFHTYSSYGRGGEALIGAYRILDLMPKGRNETKIMDWMRRHDEYEKATDTAACCHS